MFLMAILLSGSFAWLGAIVSYFSGIAMSPFAFNASVFSVVGGLLFGMGAAFNNGCGVSTISKLARGQFAMIATVTGWFLGWIAFAVLTPILSTTQLDITPEFQNIGLALVSLIVVLCIYRMDRVNRRLWLVMMVIGVMASLVFLYEPKWTPSGLLKDVSLGVWYGDASLWPSAERFLLIGSLLIGMFSAAIHKKSFEVELVGMRGATKHLFAGVLMGIGAVLASGGNDTQLLLALPAFSPAGLLSVISMLLGIYIGRRVVLLIQ
nr:YeeE/YedE thiosulfate transporter family protein [Vibrio tapetis]